jgi:hypothetical protein
VLECGDGDEGIKYGCVRIFWKSNYVQLCLVAFEQGRPSRCMSSVRFMLNA